MGIHAFMRKIKVFEPNPFVWICYLFIISLFLSRAGLSISGVLLLLYSLYNYFKNPFQVRIKPIHLLLFAIYAVNIVSVLFSSDLNGGFRLLFKNAVLLILPLAFLFYREVHSLKIGRFLWLYLLLVLLCVSANSVDALLNYHQFLVDISNSKNVESGIGPAHQELGVLSAIAFVFGFYLLKNTCSFTERFLLYLVLAVVFVQLHIIAYRFSVIVVYLLGFLYIGAELLRKKNIKLFSLASLGFVIVVYLLNLIPSVHQRYLNTVDDLKTVTEGRNPNFQSFTQRILAIRCAAEVIKEHPWFGVSPLNASDKMQEQYKKNSYLLIPENRIFIHNQFIYYALCFGIPFGVLCMLGFLILIFREYGLNPLLFWVMLVFLFQMMVENTLERQITTNAFIFLFLVLRNRKSFSAERESDSSLISIRID
ncbi:MAG TPA: O-antigen ligase family protein [Pelobium sp.]